MNESVQRKIYYRKAVFSDKDKTLQEFLSDALSMTNVGNRQETFDPSETLFRLINTTKEYHDMLFCQMILVDSGASQPIVIYDDNLKSFQIDAVFSTNLIKKRRKQKSDFVDSMLYFGVRENEVVVLASQALSIRSLEVHLKWLLKEATKVVPDNVDFGLTKEPPRDVEDRIRSCPVKSIEIGSSIVSPNQVKSSDEYVAQNSFSIGVTAVKALLERVRLPWPEGITEDANLSAKIVLTYNRRTDDVGHDLLNKLGTTLRNLDDSDLKISLEGGGVIAGEDLNLCKIIRISKTKNGLYCEDEIYHEMSEWLTELLVSKEMP